MIIGFDNMGFRNIITTENNGLRTIIGFDDVGFRNIAIVISTGGC